MYNKKPAPLRCCRNPENQGGATGLYLERPTSRTEVRNPTGHAGVKQACS